MKNIWRKNNMEIQIKKTVKAGNSSAVVLPRSWLNKEVRVELVEKTPEIILIDTLEIIKKHLELKEIIGIYLVGSHARNEENENSDIDILVISENISLETINEGIYSITIISKDLLKQKLDHDLFPIGMMIKEAKPLLNENYLKSIEIKITKNNLKWYLDTTKDKLELIEKAIEISKKRNINNLSDKIAYTLILRIRTLYIIRKLIENQKYSNKDFLNKISTVSGGINPYNRYLAMKNNSEDKKMLDINESERLYKYLNNELSNIKKLLNS